ncbi:MAG: His/Gly/Thr/Pro-type tRNA ligase C-terminal domain-containing protein [Porticoccaceae bacterium]|nr:His/Gly/Thr/Pro-type tRNA ligase C-terminal domain-containing protein [Porticoccaceae bacterium]
MLTISETFNDYASRLANVFAASSLRVELDNSNEKIGYKIRQQTLQKVPFMLIVGANEVESNCVNLRLHNGEQISFDDIESAVDYLTQACRPPDVIDQQELIQTSIQALKTV